MGLLSFLRPNSGGRRSDRTPPTQLAAAQLPNRSWLRLSADGQLDVVGESHYQPAISEAAGGCDCQGGENAFPVAALLVPEPSNQHDANAVRVDVAGRTVGYLAREDAAHYQPTLLGLLNSGSLGWCPAFICGGGERYYGVFLRVSEPDRLVPVNSPEGLYLLPADRQAAVTGEERHQDVLAEVAQRAGRAQTMSLFAVLAVSEIVKGKYAGQPGVEVLVDGRRVGELTKVQADRYLSMVREAQRTGQRLGCDARLSNGPKGWQVAVLLPDMR